jgi:hypothetical protein
MEYVQLREQAPGLNFQCDIYYPKLNRIFGTSTVILCFVAGCETIGGNSQLLRGWSLNE